MKKLLMMIMLLYAAIGARAAESSGSIGASSSYDVADGVFTVVIGDIDEYGLWITNGGYGYNQSEICRSNNVTKIIFKTEEGVKIPVSLDQFYWIGKNNDKTVDFSGATFEGYPVTLNLEQRTLNIIVPAECNISGFISGVNHNYFKIANGEVTALINNASLLDWPSIKGDNTRLTLVSNVGSDGLDLSESGFMVIDLSGITVDGTVTVPEGSTVYVKDEAAKEKISGTDAENIKVGGAEQPDDPTDKTIVTVSIAEGQTLEEALAMLIAEDAEIKLEEITFLTVKEGDINQADLAYIGADMPKLQKLNVRYVTFTGELNFYEALKGLTGFKGLYFPDAMTELPDRFFSNALNKQYAINRNIVYIWSQRAADGTGEALDLSMVSDYLGKADMRVRVFGNITTEDIAMIDNTFYTSKRYNFYDAKFVYADGESFTTFVDKLAVPVSEEGYRAYNSILFPKGTTVDELKTTFGKQFCNGYAIVEEDVPTVGEGAKSKTLYAIGREGSRLKQGLELYETMEDNVETAVIFAGKTANDINWTSFIDALGALRHVKILDLSRLGELYQYQESTFLTTDKPLADFNAGEECSVVAVKLPAHCPIHDSWYSETSIPVVMRTYDVSNITNSIWKQVYGNTTDMLICEMFVNKPGYLKNAGNINNVIRKDVKMLRLRGHMSTETDAFDALNGCRQELVNFTGLTTYPTDFTAFKSDYTKYIALPNNCTIADQAALKDNCPNLHAAGLLEKADATTGENDYRFRYRSFVPGSADRVVCMVVDPGVPSAAPVKASDGETDALEDNASKTQEFVYNITEVQMKGFLNMYDICVGASMDENGHYVSDGSSFIGGALNYFKTDLNGEEDIDSESKKYIIAAVKSTINLVKADFSDGLFADYDESGNLIEHPEDMTFNMTSAMDGCSNIILPRDARQTTIPASSLSNMKNMTSICIPGNIKRIERDVFKNNSQLIHITTTGVDKDGNGSYAEDAIIDNGDRTMTLPAGLEFIGTGAFYNVLQMTDVYVLAEEAPVCEKDAFDSRSYVGNNSFYGLPVSRDSYVDVSGTGGGNPYMILHFPSTVTEEQAKKYTDVTRQYTLTDNTGDTDGNGHLKIWPSEIEWATAYTQACTGYTWNAWSKETNRDKSWGYGSEPTEEDLKDVVVDENATFDTQYTGWHQFVLSNSVFMAEPELDMHDYSRFKRNDWYTICVPYNMRKSDLLRIFGDEAATAEAGDETAGGKYPEVRTLVGVTRDMKNERITLHISRDLVTTDFKMNEDKTAAEYMAYESDDPIVIKEGFPYLIHPYMPEDKLAAANAGEYVVGIMEQEGDSHVTGPNDVRIPVIDHIVTAMDENKTVLNTEGNTWKYQFVGCYMDKPTPIYSYFFGLSKSQQKNIWFYLNVDKDITWGQYSSIIAANAECSVTYPTLDDAKAGANPKMTFFGNNDDLVFGSAAKYNMAFDDDNSEVTGISDIKAGNAADDSKVYNLNGLYVGNSLNGLAKGIYIVNGKKYVVE